MWPKVWSVVEKNRWTVLVPMLGAVMWIMAGICCTPETKSPTRPTVMVNAAELQQDYQQWVSDCNLTAKRFEYAATDIKQQQEKWTAAENALMQVSTGNVTSWTGLLGLLSGSGLIGLFADNIRKNGVIGGLKRNNTPTPT